MIHLITMAGNSKRFLEHGFAHKALYMIDGKTCISRFIDSLPDFHDYQTLFVCRQFDLERTALKEEIASNTKSNTEIIGIPTNEEGPIYSISQVFDKIPDDQSVLITYVDLLQQTSLTELEARFQAYDGGITLHSFDNPHWRTNQSYCLVEHDQNLRTTRIEEKFDFSNFDFSQTNKAASNGSYYFKSGQLMKTYFEKTLTEGKSVNDEYYVTQALELMVKDSLHVEGFYCPYVSWGLPADVDDYEFWLRWFKGCY